MKKKKDKQKITYIDDNSTVVDMGGTKQQKSKSSFKEKARTYFSTVRKMIMPMLITLFVFTLLYVVLLAATGRL